MGAGLPLSMYVFGEAITTFINYEVCGIINFREFVVLCPSQFYLLESTKNFAILCVLVIELVSLVCCETQYISNVGAVKL